MNRTRALAPLASLAVALLATACHPVDLGHDGDTGGAPATGGGDGAGGDENAVGGANGGTGGDQNGSGGATEGGSGGQSMGSGGGSAFACPTAVHGALSSFARAPYEPQGVVVDANAIYWTAAAQGIHTGAVLRTDLASGTTVELATAALDPALPSSSFDYPCGLALAAGDVVWTAGDGGQVVRVPTAGGAATTLYDDNSPLHIPGTGTSTHTFAIDAMNVYWYDVTRSGDIMTNLLLAAPLTGAGPVTTLASTTADPNDSQAPPWMPTSIRVDGGTAFYVLLAPANNGSVTRRVGIDGQNGADLFPGGDFIALDGGNLYATSDPGVVSMTEAGANPAAVPGATSTAVIGSYEMIATYQTIVVHGGDLYFTSYGSASEGQSLVQGCGWVTKVAKTGGTQTVLWAGAGRPYDLAVDDTSVTWSDSESQSVMRLVP